MSKMMKATMLLVVLGAMVGACIGGRAFSETTATAPANTGRFMAAAPDLTFDTATGEAKNSLGIIVQPAVEPGGTTVGKYSAAGYIVSVTTATSISALGRSDVFSRLVKGISVVDTTTGRLVVNQRVYFNEPVSPYKLQ